jgi:hypothetical protein
MLGFAWQSFLLRRTRGKILGFVGMGIGMFGIASGRWGLEYHLVLLVISALSMWGALVLSLLDRPARKNRAT